MVRSDRIHRLPNNALDLVLFHLLDPHNDKTSVREPMTARELSNGLTPESYSDVIAFRLLDRRFNDIYKLRFCQRPPILSMPRRALDKLLIYLLGTQGAPFTAMKEHGYPPYLGVTPSDLSSSLPPNELKDVLNFRLVNNAFNNTYKLRFYPKPMILQLPAEIRDMILEYHVHMNTDGKIMPTDKKASLSVESFALQLPSPEDSNRTANFRLVCREFAQRALVCQFTRVSIRFSDLGFKRLQWVAERPHLAKTVKQFSYMIPRFYSQDSRRFEEILEGTKAASEKLRMQLHERQQTNGNPQRPTVAQLQSRLTRSIDYEAQIAQTITKADQQRQIIDDQKDFRGLFFALTTFKNLQQIRFMKVVDQVDAGWAKFLESHPEYATEFRSFEWNIACEHAARTLTEALLASNARTVHRLSSRFIDPRTPLNLTAGSNLAISNIARRLNSLELEFDNRMNLDEKVEELSELFRIVFTEAVNLHNLHVGFRRLVSVPIGTVFHDVKLEKLSYLGLHQWELESGELVDLLLRYRHIKYLRLRYIQLKRGSWAKVLKAIRLNLTLSWVSLRGICYPSNQELGGMHFAPFPLGQGPDDTDDDSDPDDVWDGSGNEATDDEGAEEELGGEQDEEGDNENDGTDRSEDGDGSDDNESVLGHANHVGSPSDSTILQNQASSLEQSNDRQPTRRPSNPGRCYCYNGYAWNSLDDNLIIVQQRQWKKWQEWLLKPCKLHDPDSAKNDSDSDSE